MEIKFNSDIFFDFIGRLKIATVILGFLDMIFTAVGYYSFDSRDKAFLAFVIICFLLSLAWVLGVMFGLFIVEGSHIKFDMIYHVCASLLLLITGIFFMISVFKNGGGTGKMVTRILALTIGFGNSALYGYLPWKLLKAS